MGWFMNSDCGFGKVFLSYVEKVDGMPSVNKFGIPYNSSLLFKIEVFWVNATDRLKKYLSFLWSFAKSFYPF